MYIHLLYVLIFDKYDDIGPVSNKLSVFAHVLVNEKPMALGDSVCAVRVSGVTRTNLKKKKKKNNNLRKYIIGYVSARSRFRPVAAAAVQQHLVPYISQQPRINVSNEVLPPPPPISFHIISWHYCIDNAWQITTASSRKRWSSVRGRGPLVAVLVILTRDSCAAVTLVFGTSSFCSWFWMNESFSNESVLGSKFRRTAKYVLCIRELNEKKERLSRFSFLTSTYARAFV